MERKKKSTGDLTFTNRGKASIFIGIKTASGLMKIITEKSSLHNYVLLSTLRLNISLTSVCLVHLQTKT